MQGIVYISYSTFVSDIPALRQSIQFLALKHFSMFRPGNLPIAFLDFLSPLFTILSFTASYSTVQSTVFHSHLQFYFCSFFLFTHSTVSPCSDEFSPILCIAQPLSYVRAVPNAEQYWREKSLKHIKFFDTINSFNSWLVQYS